MPAWAISDPCARLSEVPWFPAAGLRPAPDAGRARAAHPGRMFETLLVGYDGTSHARDALALARALADDGAELLLCCVHPFQPVAAAVVAGEHGVPERAEALRRLDDAEQRAGDHVRVRRIAMAATSAASGLHAIAEQEDADLLVVGSSHRSAAGRLLLGSTTTQALNAPPCAVAVAPAGLAEREVALRRVLVGFDGGREATAAVATAARLAAERGAALTVLSVVEPVTHAFGWAGSYAYPEYRRDALALAREGLDEVVAGLSDALRVETEVVEGVADRELVAASGRADLLVVGSRGYGPIRRALLGGVSARVAGATACPLLVLPRTAPAPEPVR